VTLPTDEVGRQARQALLHAGEPGDWTLTRFVAAHGPVEAVARLRAGHDPAKDGRHTLRLRAADLDRELDRAEAARARLVCPGDPEWPTWLLDGLVAEPGPGDVEGGGVPYALWVRGPLVVSDVVDRAVAVVGARASTAYGEHTATELASGLSDQGWTVVSGAAYGIDGAAHRATLAVGGTTVAVLAGGVDDAYPRGHRALLDRVAESGLVVSELPLSEHPTRSRFLERNRIIAALSRGTVAVEMARRSGAANTLGHTVRLRRHVMVVPGPVTSPLSAGCHAWVQADEASLVCDATDVLGLVAPLGEVAEPDRRGTVRPTDALGPDALQVYDALPARAAVPMDQVEALSRLPVAETGDALRLLLRVGLVEVVKGEIRRSPPTRRGGP
jgi:DNA processing protein